MARPKKERLKKRKDNRFKAKWHGKQFYGTTQEEAFAKRNAYKAAVESGVFPTQKVSEYGIPWLKRTFPKVSQSTYAGLAVHLQHLIDEIGEKPISSVIPSDLKNVYTNQYKNCSDSYMKSAKQLYSSLFDSAVADGLCRSNPARQKTAKPHKGSGSRTRPITDQEREWILTYCTDHRAHPVVMTMLYAGLRPQEAKAFVIDRDVDFKNDIITLHESAHNDGQKYKYTKKGKTDKALRQIPLFPPLKAVLQGKTGNLISSAHGERVTHTTWRVAWNSYKFSMETAINGMQKRWYGRTKEHKKILAEKKPLPEWKTFDIVPYDLRHSFCVMCRDSGVEMNTCRKWMGHTDAKMILQVYDSVSEDRSESERKKVETLLIGVQNGVQDKNRKSQSD